jgi:hypothetical protein
MTALVMTMASVEAATWRWDTSSASGYQAGSGVWESSFFWTQNGTALTNWPGIAEDSVLNVAAGDSVITISSTVSVYGLQMADQNSRQLTVTGGMLKLGAGGLHTLGTGTQIVESAVELTADQTWRALSSASVNSPVYGQVSGPYSIAVAGDTFRALKMYNTDNTYSGGTIVNNDGIMQAASASGGTPFGTGPLTIMSRGQLWLRPDGSGSDVSFSAASGAGSHVNLNGLSRFYLNRELQNAVSLTLGHAADSDAIFVRTNRAVGVLMGGTGTPPTFGDGLHQVFVAGGSARVPLHNTMVAPYIYNGQYQGGGVGRLLAYTDDNGFTNLTYDLTNTFAGADNTKKILFNGGAGTVNVTNSVSVYAIDSSGTARFTLGSGVTLHIGDDASGYSALFLNGNSVTAAVGAVGASLDFGANEAIIHQNNNATAKIGVPISGSNGVTFVSSYLGTLTLTEDNVYLGPTAVNGLTLNVGEGGTKGTLGASTNLYLGQPGTLQFNRSDVYAWSGSVVGSGTLQQNGSGTLNVSAVAGGVGVSVANVSGGIFNLTLLGNNQLDTVRNTGGGLLTLNGDTSATNIISGTSFTAANDNGTVDIQSGNWAAGTIASGSSDTTLRGTLRVGSGATFSANDARGISGLLLIDGGDVFASQIDFGSRENVPTDGSGGRLIISNGTFTTSSTLAGLGNRQGFDGKQTGGTVYFSAPPGVTYLGGVSTRANPSRIVTNTYTLSGGTLLLSPTLRGQSAAGATNENRFIFNGGMLSAATLDFGLINGGVLTNSGGVVAPGSTGTAGRTLLTGSYVVDQASAGLALDVGGTTAASSFQQATGRYDVLTISSNASLAGAISARLINGFVPVTGTSFTVLSAASVSGAFANAPVSGSTIPAWQGSTTNGFFEVTYNTNNVVLTYQSDGSGPALTPFEQWQVQYFGGTNTINGLAGDDFDGDGITNGDEFQSGTVPTNNASALEVVNLSVSGGNVVVTWNTSGGDPSGSFGSGKTNILEVTGGGTAGYNGMFTNAVFTNVITLLGDQITNHVVIGGALHTGNYFRIRLPSP